MRGGVARLIRGTAAFMSRIEYMTPSGRPPNRRIRMVSRAMPAPKISWPLGVVGLVT